MNDARGVRLLFWPGWRQLAFAFLVGSAEAVLFGIVYGGTNWIANQHSWRITAHTPLDLEIPFVPAATVVYLSLNPMLWTMAFVLRTRREIVAFVGTLAAATLVAGVFFLVLPAAHAYRTPSAADLGAWQGWYQVMRMVALEHNYLPSLHVAFVTICVRVLMRYRGWRERAIVLVWGGAIVVSTLLTHQHYLLDVITGFMLGWIAVSVGYDRWRQPSIAGEEQRHLPSRSSDRATLA